MKIRLCEMRWMDEVKVILFGLGAMGSYIARFALKKKGLEVVGALEIAKDKVGKDLGEVLGIEKHLGIQVTNDPKTLYKVKSDIVIHATGSYLPQVYPQITKCVKAGINVVSTCEELSYPYYKFPKLAFKLNNMAKKNGVTVLGTGINPGYLMDTLPIILTGLCVDIKSIKVTRMMFSGNRRNSYQKKIGTGLSTKVFNQMIKDGKMTGHVGLVESICMITTSLGWKLDAIIELPPDPVITEKETKTTYTAIKPHHLVGLKSVAYGIKNGEKVITLEFVSHANIETPYDSVTIEGVPTIHERIEGGVHGDLGTVAMVINSIPKVIKAKPGLITMKDLPIPSAVIEDLRTYIIRM
jgi:4-hydroxy-tetrahydrodipicolinate reductase